jgi:hypothetical protein
LREPTDNRYSLSDDKWDQIKYVLPGHKDSGVDTTADYRLFVEAVLYKLSGGYVRDVTTQSASETGRTSIRVSGAG